MATERLKSCDNIVALSRELGVHRGLLYHWREQGEPLEGGEDLPGNSSESKLRQQVSALQQALAEKTLELDFFKGALQKVEARRRSSAIAGEQASTTKSKK
jgi:transposase-like protein